MTQRDPLDCECCANAPAVHWMEWGEWLCSECAAQAIDADTAFGELTPK